MVFSLDLTSDLFRNAVIWLSPFFSAERRNVKSFTQPFQVTWNALQRVINVDLITLQALDGGGLEVRWTFFGYYRIGDSLKCIFAIV